MNADSIKISQEELDLIDRYLKDDLEGAELSSFKDRLINDGDWEKKVHEVQLLSLGIQESLLRDKLDAFHKNISKPTMTAVSGTSNLKRWLVAASIIAIAVLAGLFLFEKPKHEKLFSSYFSQDPGLPVVMGTEEKNYTLYDGMIDYKEGNEDIAIKKWKSIGDKTGYTDTLHYYIGVAYLNEASYTDALQYLDKVAAEQSVYTEKAKWYKALVYVKIEDTEAAKTLLQELGDYPKAKELYQQLGR